MAIPGQDGSLDEQVYTLVGFWLEAMIYGVYAIMFTAAVMVSLRNRRNRGAFSWVFFLSMISMFTMISVYTFINLYRGIRAYALNVVPPMPVAYYQDLARWDNYAFGVIVVFLTWHADALVIYRCYVIWAHNRLVIIVPLLLLLCSVVVGIGTLVSAKDPSALSPSAVNILFHMVYPVNLAQNILTTGLISYRIWTQRARVPSITRISSGFNLLTVIRIIIESAVIYTAQQFILLILFELRHPAQVILHATFVPSIGLIFVLMTLRTHFARSDSESSWGLGGVSGARMSSRHQTGTASVAIITTRTVTQDHPMDVINSSSQTKSDAGRRYSVYADAKASES